MRKGSRLSVGLVQFACGDSFDENLDKARARVREAAAGGAQIICLPELFRTPYPCQTRDAARFEWAEPIPGPTTETLCGLARELDCVILAPLFERRAADVYHNSVAVIDAGRVLGVYRKMHVPDDPQYRETFYFTPGDQGFKTFQTRFGIIGVLICWDQWFPEAARLTALQGARVLFYPSAIGWSPDEQPEVRQREPAAWRTIQQAHAIANGCYVAAVNRVGLETDGAAAGTDTGTGIEFWGRSFLAGPMGEIITEADEREAVLVAECDMDYLDEVRRDWPFFRDRRVDAYGPLQTRGIEAARRGAVPP